MTCAVPVVKADSSDARYTASGDFGSGADASHRLARDEIGFHLRQRLAAGGRLIADALAQRRRFDGARADGIAADAARDVVGRHGLGHADHGGCWRRRRSGSARP
jgi:hypothetical protein